MTNAPPHTPSPPVPAWRAWLTLALLMSVAILSYVDRQIFGILMEPIRIDLGLDRKEIGLIAGLSFSVFYLLGAFPIARLADRGDRPLIVALCVGVWSLATAACGLAQNVWQLVLARVGLAAGEGGAGPASQSLVLHLFPPQRRTLVLGSLMAASAVGIGGGGWIGGVLSQHYTWRESMIIVGLPGLVVALLVWVLAAEPRRREKGTIAPPPQLPIREVLRYMARNPSLRWIAATIILVSSCGFPFLIWSGSFYQTVHGMSVRESGDGLFWPITGGLVIGNLLAGWITDRFGKGNPRFAGAIAAFGPLAGYPFGIAMALVSDPTLSLACFFVFHILITLHLPPMFALAFAQVPVAMRAMLGATVNAIITLCGIGIGTFLVGALSDWFGAHYGAVGLRYAMVTMASTLVLAAFTAWRAGATAKPL